MRKPVREFHGKTIERWLPIADRHGPLPGNIADSEVNDLVDGLIGGKNAMIARDLAQGHIHRLNGVGGVDDLADVLWESK
jgi:hypothetical protein